MQSAESDFLSDVAAYYAGKLERHGETPQGVDWNGSDGQILRFQQLCKVFAEGDNFSVNDLGCGFGSLYEFLTRNYKRFDYAGFDISEDMIKRAKERNHQPDNARFAVAAHPDGVADYGVASGIFNVRLRMSNQEWLDYLEATLEVLDETSRKGFAFNCLTSYSDTDKMRDYLYYANPVALFDLCKRRYARNVCLLHDYGLYEFTIIVRK